MHAVAALPELPPLPRLLLRLLLLLLLRLLLLLGEPTMPSARRRGRSHSEMTVSAQDGSGEAYIGLVRSSPTCLSPCAHDLDEGGMLRYMSMALTKGARYVPNLDTDTRYEAR